MTKRELRKIYLRKRAGLSDAEYVARNSRLCDRFFAGVKLSGIRVLHTFLPIQRHREVNTWLIVERVRTEFPEIRIAVPKINNQSAELEHYYFEGPSQLELNTWDIPEPVRGVPTPVREIDAVLVPLLAFDRQGHRLGYGRGFYDRFLSGCRPDCLKIGLSLFGAEERIQDIDETDVPLNIVVTPDETLRV